MPHIRHVQIVIISCHRFVIQKTNTQAMYYYTTLELR